eukprot:scaffold26467_cov28-Prasinocladus_malaysianus.AAC.1
MLDSLNSRLGHSAEYQGLECLRHVVADVATDHRLILFFAVRQRPELVNRRVIRASSVASRVFRGRGGRAAVAARPAQEESQFLADAAPGVQDPGEQRAAGDRPARGGKCALSCYGKYVLSSCRDSSS